MEPVMSIDSPRKNCSSLSRPSSFFTASGAPALNSSAWSSGSFSATAFMKSCRPTPHRAQAHNA